MNRRRHRSRANFSVRSRVLIGATLVLVPLAANQVAGVVDHRRQTFAADTTSNPASTLPGRWTYMPGTSVESGGLRILDSDFSIVHQDGSGGQANPPVNLLGTHLNDGGDFTLIAQMSQITGTAGLQLYAQAPVIQDEFRVDGPYMTISIKSGQMTVLMYDGGYKNNDVVQKPSYTGNFTIDNPQQKYDLSIARAGGQITLSINGQAQKIASFPEKQLFSTGSLWFGASSTGGTWLLNNLSLDTGTPVSAAAKTASTTKSHRHHTNHASALSSPASSPTNSIVSFTDPMNLNNQVLTPDPNGMQTLAAKKRPGFLIGAAMSLSPLASDPGYSSIALNGNFGSMTTENALKWQFVEPKPGIFDFHEGDALVSLAASHNMVVHGHNLVFSEALPRWVQDLPTSTAADKDNVKKVMNNHIQNLVSHYQGKIASWDVVNEPLADYDQFDSGQLLRSNVFQSAMGENYIAEAFKTAHAADPKAQLYINDYGLEENGSRWDAMVSLLGRLQSQGVPINGVGFESHVYTAADKIDASVLRQHIKQLESMGLKARVSEMDVYDDDGTDVQTAQYGDVLAACLAETNCVSFTSWGVSNKYDMYSDDYKTWSYGNDFLWDATMKPIPAVARLQQILK